VLNAPNPTNENQGEADLMMPPELICICENKKGIEKISIPL
jgi:hypothetical protein